MTQALKENPPLVSAYLPRAAKIVEKRKLTDGETWFRFTFPDAQGVKYLAGQFMEVSLFGIGGAPISICSAPGQRDDLEMCVRAVGDVTRAMHALNVGDTLALRGPFGNGFDMDTVAGKDLLFVAGGLGLAPCRSFILDALTRRGQFGRVTILYGGRTPKDLLFRDDLAVWAERKDAEFFVTVDRPDADWKGRTGVITTLFRQVAKSDPARTAAFIIGPPIMFKFAVLEALGRGLGKTNIHCSLERRMKCGLGMCGHCQIRNVYVCQEGPIFSYADVIRLREGI
ncbi:MAG: FAD/NAD(P)-binding protein [Planctomycetota bacterium]|nr:FAD/NAD(P)-binding protein [Planctomycetota bacterium]